MVITGEAKVKHTHTHARMHRQNSTVIVKIELYSAYTRIQTLASCVSTSLSKSLMSLQVLSQASETCLVGLLCGHVFSSSILRLIPGSF